MNGRIIFSLMVCFFLSACGNNKPAEKKSQSPSADSAKPKIISIKKGLSEGIEVFKVHKVQGIDMRGRMGDSLIYCSKKGKIELVDTNQDIRKEIIDLGTSYLVNKLFIVPYSTDKWFVMWEETTMDGVRSFAAVYGADVSKPEWKLSFHDPNPAKPVIDGDAAYISTLGLAAKVSLTDGNMIWQKDSLFNTGNLAYQEMEKALVYPDKVVFVDLPIPGRREKRDSLILDPVTGDWKK